MISSTNSLLLSKDKLDDEVNQFSIADKQKDPFFEPSNWNYDIMAEDTYTNKIYETLNFK